MARAVTASALVVAAWSLGLVGSGCSVLFPFAPPDDDPRPACEPAPGVVRTLDVDASAVDVEGDLLFVGTWNDDLTVYDLAADSDDACATWGLDQGDIYGVHVDGGGVNVASDSGQLVQLVASNPCGNEQASGVWFGTGGYLDVIGDGTTVYASSTSGALEAWDIGNLQVGREIVGETADHAERLALSEEHLWAALGWEYAILRVDRATHEHLRLALDGAALGVATFGDGAVVAAEGAGLVVVRGEAESLHLGGQADTIGEAVAVAVDGDFAFVCGDAGEDDGAYPGFLQAFRLGEGDPVPLFTVGAIGEACLDLAVDEANVYVAADDAVLVIPRGCAVPP